MGPLNQKRCSCIPICHWLRDITNEILERGSNLNDRTDLMTNEVEVAASLENKNYPTSLYTSPY